MLKNFGLFLLASALVMKHNLDWHRRVIAVSIPFFLVFMLFQTEYIVSRVKQKEKFIDA